MLKDYLTKIKRTIIPYAVATLITINYSPALANSQEQLNDFLSGIPKSLESAQSHRKTLNKLLAELPKDLGPLPKQVNEIDLVPLPRIYINIEKAYEQTDKFLRNEINKIDKQLSNKFNPK